MQLWSFSVIISYFKWKVNCRICISCVVWVRVCVRVMQWNIFAQFCRNFSCITTRTVYALNTHTIHYTLHNTLNIRATTRTRYKSDSWCTLGSLFIESAINWRKGIVSRATRGCFREKDVALRRYLKTNPAKNLSNSVQLEFEEKVPSLFHPLYDAKT